jgi:hypothetical protein
MLGSPLISTTTSGVCWGVCFGDSKWGGLQLVASLFRKQMRVL